MLPRDDVDTDQIIPARFLKGTTREGLGRHLFADWRCDAHGPRRVPDSSLNRPRRAQGAAVLVVGPQLRLRLLARARRVGARATTGSAR